MEIKGGEKMLGLEKEIIKRRKGRKSNSKEMFSYVFISKLLGKPYMTIRNKFKRKNFTTEEQLAIMRVLVPEELRTLDYFEYLFTEQN